MAESSEKSEVILQELKKISKILILINASTIENELSKIANTDAQDRANMVEVSRRAVSYFLEDMATAGFIEYNPYKPPVRILDYVPPSWLELLTKERKSEEKVEIKSEKEEFHA
ncbi:MAG: hypothetical protein QXN21_06670 [Candidatus Bathyarchaeia archaeon]